MTEFDDEKLGRKHSHKFSGPKIDPLHIYLFYDSLHEFWQDKMLFFTLKAAIQIKTTFKLTTANNF